MLILFNKLNKVEILKFEKIVNSSYFNSVENAKKLFYYLKSKHPDLTKEDISQAEISKVIYSGESSTSEKIWKLKSDFSKVFEKFLVQNELENNNLNYDVTLLKALKKKGSGKEIESLINKIKLYSKKQFNKDDSYYLNIAYINSEEYYFKMPEIMFEFPENLQYKSDNLDYFFVFMKLHTFYEMLIHQYNNIKPLRFNKTFLNELIEYIEGNINLFSTNHPNIYVIYLVLKMFLNKDQEKYSLAFKKYLKQNDKKLTKVQLSYYYRYLESFYQLKINEGHLNFRKEVFEIYKIMFDKDLFILENNITDKEFNNVINISLPLGKFDWTDKYIEKYKGYIQSGLEVESYNLAKAKLYFYNKEYKKVFPFLNLVHYKDPHYYINSKVLLAKVLYETDSFNSLASMLDSLRKYISRENNLNEPQVQGIKNFIKHISILAKIKSGNKKEEILILRKLIENNKKFISSKSWFIEKIEEINIK